MPQGASDRVCLAARKSRCWTAPCELVQGAWGWNLEAGPRLEAVVSSFSASLSSEVRTASYQKPCHSQPVRPTSCRCFRVFCCSTCAAWAVAHEVAASCP